MLMLAQKGGGHMLNVENKLLEIYCREIEGKGNDMFSFLVFSKHAFVL